MIEIRSLKPLLHSHIQFPQNLDLQKFYCLDREHSVYDFKLFSHYIAYFEKKDKLTSCTISLNTETDRHTHTQHTRGKS